MPSLSGQAREELRKSFRRSTCRKSTRLVLCLLTHRRLARIFSAGVHFLLHQKSDDPLSVITLTYMVMYVICCHQLPFYFICGDAPHQIQPHFCLMSTKMPRKKILFFVALGVHLHPLATSMYSHAIVNVHYMTIWTALKSRPILAVKNKRNVLQMKCSVKPIPHSRHRCQHSPISIVYMTYLVEIVMDKIYDCISLLQHFTGLVRQSRVMFVLVDE